MLIYPFYKGLEIIVNQAYNYDIYKNEFQTSDLLNAFLALFLKSCNQNEETFLSILLKNPNIINFFYYNPDLMTFFLKNNTYFQDFLNLPGIENPMTDIYQLIYNSGSIYSQYLNPNPQPVSEFSCEGLDFHLDSLLTQNSILQSLIQQNYNNNIYYLSLYQNDHLVELLCNPAFFDLLSPFIQSNPNLLNFFSQNDRLLLKLLEGGVPILTDMLAIPHIGDPSYDLNVIFYQNDMFRDCIDYPASFNPLQLCDIFVSPTQCGNANVIIDMLAGNISGNLYIESVPFGNLNITGNLTAIPAQFKDISVSNENFTNSSTPSPLTNPLARLQNINRQINQAVYTNLYTTNVYNRNTDGICGNNSTIKIRNTAPFKQYISGVRKIYIRTLNLMIPDLFRLSWSDPTKPASVSKDDPFSEGTNTVCPYFYYKNEKPAGFENGVYNKQCLLDDAQIRSLLYFGFSGITQCLIQQYPPFDVSVVYANSTYNATNTKIPIDGVMSPFHLINFMTTHISPMNIPTYSRNQNRYKFDAFVSFFYKKYSPHSLLYQILLLLQRMDLSYYNKTQGKTNCDYHLPWDFTIAGYYDTEEIKSDYQNPSLKQSEMVDIYLLYQRIRGQESLANLNSVQLFYSAYSPNTYMDFLHILSLTREVMRDVYLEFTYLTEQKTRYVQPYMYPAQFEACKGIIERYLKNKMNLAMKH